MKKFAGGFLLVLLTLAARALAISAVLATATPAAAQSATTLTPEVLSKMEKVALSRGMDRETPAQFANPLGLSAQGATWLNRTINVKSATDQTMHAFAFAREKSDDTLVSVMRNNVILAFRAGHNGIAISAFRYDNQTQTMTMISPADAQSDLNKEYTYWSAEADGLLK